MASLWCSMSVWLRDIVAVTTAVCDIRDGVYVGGRHPCRGLCALVSHTRMCGAADDVVQVYVAEHCRACGSSLCDPSAVCCAMCVFVCCVYVCAQK